MSTFIAEVLDKLPPTTIAAHGPNFLSSGSFYALVTVLVACAVAVVISGPTVWEDM